MRIKIKDLAIIKPEDKLLVLQEKGKQSQAKSISKIIEDFLNSKHRVLIACGVKVCILKKGAKILLNGALNKELEKIEKKRT